MNEDGRSNAGGQYQDQLLERIHSNSCSVAIFGLGYVGLPLALAVARAGHHVHGIDLDHSKVKAISEGRSYLEDVESSVVAQLVQAGQLTASCEAGEIGHFDVAVIAVPTPIDVHRVPDLTHVRGAAASLLTLARPGCLIVLESTTYPGSTDEIIAQPLIGQGSKLGTDIFVGYSPERIDPGNREWDVGCTPKVVAGATPACLAITSAFYATFVEHVVPVSSLRTAEITKLFENIFRIVNIALVNEFQTICEAFDIDVWEVLEACSTKPYGFMPFLPGPGLGGHCVPVDPFYLAWEAHSRRANTEFIELAGKVNASMPGYVARKVVQTLNRAGMALAGAHIGLVGVAYKRNTSDTRESPAHPILELLIAGGAQVSYHDPYVATFTSGSQALDSQELTSEYVSHLDCVVVVTDHDTIDWKLIGRAAQQLVDTRNAVRRHQGD